VIGEIDLTEFKNEHNSYAVCYMTDGWRRFGVDKRFSTILFHHSLLAPTWTAFLGYTGPDLLCSTVFHF